MKRLLWLSANCSYSHASLALPILHLAAADLGQLDWTAADALIHDDPADTALRLAAHAPDILASSLYLFNRTFVLDVLARLKALLPSVTIAVGGPECLHEGAAELLADCPFIDYAISGEGEGPFRQLLAALASGTRPTPVTGLLDRHAPPSCAVCTDWATRPAPANSPLFRTDGPFVQLETSRGCPFSCRYCTSGGTSLRFRDLADVHDDLQLLRQRGCRTIRLLDRTFNTPESRCLSLLTLFREEFPDLHFHLEVHPQFLTPAIRQELACALPGQLHLEAGIQTLDNQVLQAVGRLPNAEQALDGLRFLADCHPRFITHCDLLAGLPGQSIHSLLDDLHTLIQAHPAEIQLEVLKLLPGTPLRRDATSLGLAFAPNPPYDVMQTPTMTAEDIRQAHSLSRVIDWFHNHPLLTPTFRSALAELPDLIPLLLHTIHDSPHAFQPHQPPNLDARLRLLHRLLPLPHMPQTEFQLAVAWMTLANTPARPGQPADRAFPIHSLPTHALPLDPNAAHNALQTPGTRLWQLDGPCRQSAIFAYNRAIAPNRAAAQWTLTTPSP